MNDSLFRPEIPKLQWLSPFGLATALHLLLLVALLYAPGLSRFRQEVQEIQLVSILDFAEPGSNTVLEERQAGQPPSSPPVAQKKPKPSEPGNQATTISPPIPSDPARMINAQPQTASESGVYGQLADAGPSGETGEKREAGNPGAASPASNAPASAGGGEERESAKKRYLAKLLAHIENNKFYPPAARRRRLEGWVQVRFTLEANGRISALDVSEGEQILRQAAREAVERALPLPAPKGEVIPPLAVSYRMNFQLR